MPELTHSKSINEFGGMTVLEHQIHAWLRLLQCHTSQFHETTRDPRTCQMIANLSSDFLIELVETLSAGTR